MLKKNSSTRSKIRELVGRIITIINNERIFLYHPCCCSHRVSCQYFYQQAIVLSCLLTVKRAESSECDYIDNNVDEFLNINNIKQHPRFRGLGSAVKYSPLHKLESNLRLIWRNLRRDTFQFKCSRIKKTVRVVNRYLFLQVF